MRYLVLLFLAGCAPVVHYEATTTPNQYWVYSDEPAPDAIRDYSLAVCHGEPLALVFERGLKRASVVCR